MLKPNLEQASPLPGTIVKSDVVEPQGRQPLPWSWDGEGLGGCTCKWPFGDSLWAPSLSLETSTAPWPQSIQSVRPPSDAPLAVPVPPNVAISPPSRRRFGAL